MIEDVAVTRMAGLPRDVIQGDESMPIDWESVNWIYVGVLGVLAFFASLIGGLVAFNRRVLGALLSAILFAGLFVLWTYYPHGLPLPTSLTSTTLPAAATTPQAPPVPPAPIPNQPSNPVTTISPPNPAATTPPPANQ